MSNKETKISMTHKGRTVETTMEGLEAVTSELNGMPDRENYIISKVTGQLDEGYRPIVPQIGDKIQVKGMAAVKTVTKRKDKNGRVEHVVSYELLD